MDDHQLFSFTRFDAMNYQLPIPDHSERVTLTFPVNGFLSVPVENNAAVLEEDEGYASTKKVLKNAVLEEDVYYATTKQLEDAATLSSWKMDLTYASTKELEDAGYNSCTGCRCAKNQNELTIKPGIRNLGSTILESKYIGPYFNVEAVYCDVCSSLCGEGSKFYMYEAGCRDMMCRIGVCISCIHRQEKCAKKGMCGKDFICVFCLGFEGAFLKCKMFKNIFKKNITRKEQKTF